MAFLLAFNSPELNVEAITTVVGNVNQKKGHDNAKRLLEFLDRTDVPVARGAEKPLIRKIVHIEEFHGKTGLGDAKLPMPSMNSDSRRAHELIIQKAMELGKKLTIVAIGPLTNIATAIHAEPRLPEIVDKLVIMGGAFHITPYGIGNASAVAEFNIWSDPEAAKIVFNSGIKTTAAGLDTTTHPEYRLSKKLFEEIIKMRGGKAKLVISLCKSIIQRFKRFNLHDPMAVAYVVNPSIFETQSYKVDIETKGELTRGMTVVDRRSNNIGRVEEGNINIITKVNAEMFLDLIMDRVPKGG